MFRYYFNYRSVTNTNILYDKLFNRNNFFFFFFAFFFIARRTIWEYIFFGAGIKQLFYAINNKVPHQSITLNIMHLITHDYNPHNIPKIFPNSNMFFSLFLSPIPFISVSLSLSSKPSDSLHPAPTPSLICHHPHHLQFAITQQWCSNNQLCISATHLYSLAQVNFWYLFL